jgi:hypothetical protein
MPIDDAGKALSLGEISAQALSSTDETAKPVVEPVQPLDRLSSGRNTVIRSSPHNHPIRLAHLNRDHRRRPDPTRWRGSLVHA